MPEEDGPAIITHLTEGLSAIIVAMAAIFISCLASAIRIMSAISPFAIFWLIAPTVSMSISSHQSEVS